MYQLLFCPFENLYSIVCCYNLRGYISKNTLLPKYIAATDNMVVLTDFLHSDFNNASKKSSLAEAKFQFILFCISRCDCMVHDIDNIINVS